MQRYLIVLAVVGAVVGWASADSLFTAETAKNGTLVSDKKVRFEVGDIITVLVKEKTDATTSSDTDTKKESDVIAQASAEQNKFLVAETPGGLNILPAEQLPNWDIGIQNEHKTDGKTRRSNTLVMTISCTVAEVLQNGNIRIQGEKSVTVNREESKLQVKGTVRARDVTPANTVMSSQIADATIQLVGRGPLWNNQRRGLITKFLDWFSPF